MEIPAVKGEITPTFIEIETVATPEAGVEEAGAVRNPVFGLDETSVQIGFEHGVDNPGHGICTVDRRCPVAQHLQPPDTARRYRVGIG